MRGAGGALCGLALVIAGCCGGGPNHRCDFTPPPAGGADGGSDGPVMCGTEVCDTSQVCCVTKAPLSASCIDPSKFMALGCEKLALPCLKPTDCPGGLACCVVLTADQTGGTVSCQQELQCLAGATSFVACGSAADCPAVRPTCATLSMTDQGDFKVCE